MLGAIAVLSLVPGEYRPHSYIMSDGYEHALAYALTALIVALLPPGNLRLRWLCTALLLYSGVLEVLQTWVPGRTASIGDFIASGTGIALGFLIAAIVKPRIMRAPGS